MHGPFKQYITGSKARKFSDDENDRFFFLLLLDESIFLRKYNNIILNDFYY